MWPFNKKDKPKAIYRYRTLDWTKVKTVEEVIFILSKMNHTKNIRVSEDCWADMPHLMGGTVTEKIYSDGYLEETKEYDEPISKS